MGREFDFPPFVRWSKRALTRRALTFHGSTQSGDQILLRPCSPPPLALIATAAFAAKPAQPADPYLWLENVEGEKPLATVKQWNAETEAALTRCRATSSTGQRALAMLNDPRQIALPDEVMGDLVANHWVDADHKRGLWRVSPLADYLAGKPHWRTLIDVDALGKAEGKSWVWHGAKLPRARIPAMPRVIEPRRRRRRRDPRVRLARGPVRRRRLCRPPGQEHRRAGSTATLCWSAAVEGEGTATRSGYPRIVKRWRAALRGARRQSSPRAFPPTSASVPLRSWTATRAMSGSTGAPASTPTKCRSSPSTAAGSSFRSPKRRHSKPSTTAR